MRRVEKPKAALGTWQLVILILAVHFALGALYSVVIPLWEGHDEWAHPLDRPLWRERDGNLTLSKKSDKI